MVVQSGCSFVDRLISEIDPITGVSGLPTGTWIQISGSVGSGKSSLAIQLLDRISRAPGFTGEVWHCDFEMREPLARRFYRSLGARFPGGYVQPGFPFQLLDRIYDQARLHRECSTPEPMVVLIDDFGSICPTKLQGQIDLATRIKDQWAENPNLLLLTINHVNKRGAIGGASRIAQLCDVIIRVERRNGFTYLSTPKNRCQAPNAPLEIKLRRDEGIGFSESAEPDFISELSLVQFLRSKLG